MVAQKVSGTPAIRGARGDRKADERGSLEIKVAVFGGRGAGAGGGIVKTGADQAFLFARAYDFVDPLGAVGRGYVRGRLNVSIGRFVFLQTERGNVFLVHWRE